MTNRQDIEAAIRLYKEWLDMKPSKENPSFQSFTFWLESRLSSLGEGEEHECLFVGCENLAVFNGLCSQHATQVINSPPPKE